LQKKSVAFVEIDLWQEPGRRAEMMQRADGRRTVPQLFIGGQGIGGSDELAALEANGELDALLDGS
jgi:glutaredoxin 3